MVVRENKVRLTSLGPRRREKYKMNLHEIDIQSPKSIFYFIRKDYCKYKSILKRIFIFNAIYLLSPYAIRSLTSFHIPGSVVTIMSLSSIFSRFSEKTGSCFKVSITLKEQKLLFISEFQNWLNAVQFMQYHIIQEMYIIHKFTLQFLLIMRIVHTVDRNFAKV